MLRSRAAAYSVKKLVLQILTLRFELKYILQVHITLNMSFGISHSRRGIALIFLNSISPRSRNINNLRREFASSSSSVQKLNIR